MDGKNFRVIHFPEPERLFRVLQGAAKAGMLVIKVFSSLKSVGSHYQQFIIFVVSRLRLIEHPWDRSKVALITSLLYYPKKFSNKLVFSRTTFLQLVDLLVNIHSKGDAGLARI